MESEDAGIWTPTELVLTPDCHVVNCIVLEAHHVVSVSVGALGHHQSRQPPGVSMTRGREREGVLEIVNLNVIL